MLEMMSPGRRLGAGLRDEDVAALARNGGLRLGFNARPLFVVPPIAPPQRGVGMSGLGLDPGLDYPDPVYDGGVGSPYPTSGGGTGNIWEAQLPTLIGLGLRDLRDIFAPTQTSQADYRSQQQQPQYYPQTAVAPRTSATFAAGAGGINFLGTQISWPILIIGGLILFFPGFSRRRNPAPMRRANPARKSNRHRRHVKRAQRRR